MTSARSHLQRLNGNNITHMKYLLSFGWLCFLILSCTVAQDGYKKIRSNQTRIISGKTYYVHKVKKKQTLYSISKAYDVSMEAVIARNPEIRKGLKKGQILFIPATELDEQMYIPPVLDPKVPDPDEVDPYVPYKERRPCGTNPKAHKEVYNVALMIHLFVNESDSINTNSPTMEEINQYNSLRYIQFYEGFLLALEQLKQAGLSLNLYVYDVDPNPSNTYKMLRKSELANMDLIVGMMFHRNFQIVASWARKQHIPIISPISRRTSQLEGNPMVVKIRPTYSSIGARLIEYLTDYFPYAHTLIVRDNEPDMRQIADQVFANGKSMGLDVSVIEDKNLINHLIPAAENVVVVVSKKKTYALDKLAQLNADTMDFNFTVFGIPGWNQFEGMDYEYLVKANTHVLTPYFVDYKDDAVRNFVELFQQNYKTDPDLLAFQGYDIAWYFLQALHDFGTDFLYCLREIQTRPLQTRYKFRQYEGDGWENNHWEIIRYDNYAIYRIE